MPDQDQLKVKVSLDSIFLQKVKALIDWLLSEIGNQRI